MKDWYTPAPLKQNVKCDVCVVGLGASGLTAAIDLTKAGYRVVGIDAEDVGAAAAGRNGGFLLAGSADFYHDAVKEVGRERASEFYRETIKELDIVFRDYPSIAKRVGSLRIAADEKELECCKAQYEAMKAD